MRVPWTARRSKQSILKEISPEYSLERLMLKLKLQYFGHVMQSIRPVEGFSGASSHDDILNVLSKYGIFDNKVVLWGTGKPLREFLWSEDMADASVHVLLNVNFSDIIGIEKY